MCKLYTSFIPQSQLPSSNNIILRILTSQSRILYNIFIVFMILHLHSLALLLLLLLLICVSLFSQSIQATDDRKTFNVHLRKARHDGNGNGIRKNLLRRKLSDSSNNNSDSFILKSENSSSGNNSTSNDNSGKNVTSNVGSYPNDNNNKNNGNNQGNSTNGSGSGNGSGNLLETNESCEKYDTLLYCSLYGKCVWINGVGCVAKGTTLTSSPTLNPTTPTQPITRSPTTPVNTRSPSLSPITKRPTMPTLSPSFPTSNPTVLTTRRPTSNPVASPSKTPTTSQPTTIRTQTPTLTPSSLPSQSPAATSAPTQNPTRNETGVTDGGDANTDGYDIDIIFTNANTPDNIKQAFNNAMRFWESLIITDIQSTYIYRKFSACFGLAASVLSYDKYVDDLLIFADIAYIDGRGNVLGSAGPCIATNVGGRYVRVGLMRFDSADLEALYADGTLEAVITHEMGHVIGFGTLWGAYKLRDSTGEYYTGAGGIEGLGDLAKSSQKTLTDSRPLIETNGGSGTAGGHWDEDTYKNELMTGWLSPDSKLSVLTVKAMKDLGFEVDPSVADSSYVLPGSTMRDQQEWQELRVAPFGAPVPTPRPTVAHNVNSDIINLPLHFDDDNVVKY